MSERIDHAANSRRAIDTVHDWQGREGETDAAMLAEVGIAQAEATLALVEQQKVANLIALDTNRHARTERSGSYWGGDLLWVPGPTPASNMHINPSIAAALGIGANHV